MMRLRVHHLLCSALYVGKGYNEAFCANMQRVVEWLWKDGEGEKREVLLIAEPDNICVSCPNLVYDRCKLDDNHVVSKDAALAHALGLEIDCIYPVSELLHIVGSRLTAEIFEESCQNCEWYEQGLCDYEQLARKYGECRTNG